MWSRMFVFYLGGRVIGELCIDFCLFIMKIVNSGKNGEVGVMRD